jgi:hypothetical protein
MEKRKNKEILALIHKHTHLKDEDGEDVPFFSFVRDMTDTIDLDMSEEQIAEVALDNGYKVYKSFPEETMVGGLIICAEGCPREAVDRMYQEFYGEVPPIQQWPLEGGLNEEKDGIELTAINAEEEAQKGSEQFQNKFLDKAASLGATIEFHDKLLPKRMDSTWYDGEIALIKYKNFEITVYAGGYLKMHLDGVKDSLMDVEDLEANGIFTDDELKAYTDDNTLYYDNRNSFQFSLKKKDSSVWLYNDELGYDRADDLNSALDIDFYINTVIPDVIERYYRTNEDIELEPSNKFPFEYEEGHTLDEYMSLYGELYNSGDLWDHEEEDLIIGWEEGNMNSSDFNAYNTFWLIDGRFYEVPKNSKDLKENSEEVYLTAVDVEAESKKGSEQFMAKFIDQAASLGATIEFFQDISPKKQDAFWYDGDIAKIKYKDYSIIIGVSGGKKLYLTQDEEPIRTAEQLEERGIFTDEEMFSFFESGELVFEENNWFDFHVVHEKEREVFYRSDLHYDDEVEVGLALDMEFYINEVIPNVESKLNESQELKEDKNKDSLLAKAGVSEYNKPKKTPNHPTKSHVVVARYKDRKTDKMKKKLIRFGQQGIKGSPKKKGESDSYRKRRKAFKARHAKDIDKGPESAAYWANKYKW